MKKILISFLLGAFILAGCTKVPTNTNTNVNTNTNQGVTQGTAIDGYEFTEEEQYWADRLTNGDDFTEAEVQQIPEKVIDAIVPQVIKIISREGLIGGNIYDDSDNFITCRGVECDKILSLGLGEELNPIGASFITGYRTTLRSSMTSSQTTVPVSSMETKDGHTITFSDVGNEAYLTIEPGANKEEIVRVTGISSLNWTGATRGLAFYGTATSTVAANQKTHNAGSVVIMSNVHYIFETLVDKDSSETIEGTKKFTVYPEIFDATSLCDSNGEFCTKLYVDNVGAGGFTASNIGDGKTLRANSTAPETLDVNTSTPDLSFIIEEGKFELNTSTPSKIQQYWDDRYNATTTKEVLTLEELTTSRATSTDSFSAGELCFDGVECVTRQWTEIYYSSSTQQTFTNNSFWPIRQVSVPALGANDALYVRWFGRLAGTASGTDGHPTLRFDSATTTAILGDPGTATVAIGFEALLVNNAATNSQFVTASSFTGASGAATTASSTITILSIDTSDGVIIDIVQPTANGWSNDILNLNTLYVEIRRNYLSQ